MFSLLVKRQNNKTVLLVKPKTTTKQLEDILQQTQSQSQITNEQIKKLHNILRSKSFIPKLDFTNLQLVYAQYIAIRPTSKDYFNILSQPLDKIIDPKYVYEFALMADDFVTNFEITHFQNYSILNSLNNGFRIIQNGDMNDLTFDSTLLPRSQEIFLIKLFYKLCDRIMTDQYKNSMILACKIMKVTRMWHRPLLDKINQELLSQQQISLELKVIYIQTLLRAGQQIFPETIYILRDELLTMDLLKIDLKRIHQLFDIFARSRLQLTNAIIGKLMFQIIDQFHLLSHYERISFVFICSKYSYQPHSVLKEMIFDLTQNVKSYNAIAMKMFFLCLYNIDYKDEDFFRVLKSQINLKDKVKQLTSNGKFNEKELGYFNQIGQIN